MAPSRTSGAVRPLARKAATKVVVFQWPWGTLSTSLVPRKERPRGRVMFVLAHVSSKKPTVLDPARLAVPATKLSAVQHRDDPALRPSALFFQRQLQLAERRTQSLTRQFRAELVFEFLQRDVGARSNDLFDPLAVNSPPRHPPPPPCQHY